MKVLVCSYYKCSILPVYLSQHHTQFSFFLCIQFSFSTIFKRYAHNTLSKPCSILGNPKKMVSYCSIFSTVPAISDRKFSDCSFCAISSSSEFSQNLTVNHNGAESFLPRHILRLRRFRHGKIYNQTFCCRIRVHIFRILRFV